MAELNVDPMKRSSIYATFGRYYGEKLYKLLFDCCSGKPGSFCYEVLSCLGISPQGSTTLVLNQQGQWVENRISEYTYEIGEYVPSEGGVIFHRYLDDGLENYLVVDITDLSTSEVWSNINSTLIGPTAQSTWNGSGNTSAIINQAGATTGAAFLCNASTNGGKNDWYLPAIDELNLLWQNRFNVNKTLSGNSSYGTIIGATLILYNFYWSSTEFDNSIAWRFLFNSGGSAGNFKSNQHYVRAVRKFSI